MSGRLLALCTLIGWLGTTLACSELRWFSRPPLTQRLRPYVAGGIRPGRSDRAPLSIESFRDVVGPLAADLGGRLSRLAGVSEDLEGRLRRTHSTLDVTDVRLRQLGWSGAALGAAVLATQLVALPPMAILVLVVGGPILAFLAVEQQTVRASRRWQERIFLELPVVAEQLGMLLSAGYSLGAALNRLSGRGHGACRTDLQLVCVRVQQGLSEMDALREWARTADVAELTNLVDVLALNREAGDLGRLITAEARSTRRQVQRRTLEIIERRDQQVWIPVTVATLVPGVLFLAVPFLEAMRLFAGG